jgi:hypothetical protein
MGKTDGPEKRRRQSPGSQTQKQKARHEGGLFVFGWETRIRT